MLAGAEPVGTKRAAREATAAAAGGRCGGQRQPGGRHQWRATRARGQRGRGAVSADYPPGCHLGGGTVGELCAALPVDTAGARRREHEARSGGRHAGQSAGTGPSHSCDRAGAFVRPDRRVRATGSALKRRIRATVKGSEASHSCDGEELGVTARRRPLVAYGQEGGDAHRLAERGSTQAAFGHRVEPCRAPIRRTRGTGRTRTRAPRLVRRCALRGGGRAWWRRHRGLGRTVRAGRTIQRGVASG